LPTPSADSKCSAARPHWQFSPVRKIAGFGFDVEILFIARRLSLSILEVPVNWVAQPGSKGNLVTDSFKMLWDICRIQWLHRRFDGNIALAHTKQLSD